MFEPRADVTGLPRYEERIFSPEQLQRGYGTLQSLRRLEREKALGAYNRAFKDYVKTQSFWDRLRGCQVQASRLESYFLRNVPIDITRRYLPKAVGTGWVPFLLPIITKYSPLPHAHVAIIDVQTDSTVIKYYDSSLLGAFPLKLYLWP